MPGVLPQVKELEKRQLRPVPLAGFRPGDTVRVHYRIVEGEKTRVQVFQGMIIRIQGKKGHSRATFTVRKVSYGIGVERTFLYNSPRLENVEVLSPGKVHKSRLFYMRALHGKSARIKERQAARIKKHGGAEASAVDAAEEQSGQASEENSSDSQE